MEFRVNFIIIGAQKSGTTSLAQQLSTHPQICFCSEKEPHFFSTQQFWKKEIAKYHGLFNPQPNQICGEASTSYSFSFEYPEVPRRLYNYNPSLKLIFILRDPVQRIRSHYAHRLMRGIADKNLKAEISLKKDYINRSKYGYSIQQFVQYFPRKQFLILFFEKYIREPHSVLREIYNFLEISYIEPTDVTAKNISVGSRRSKLSILFYFEKILSHSPPIIRRILSNYITIKLSKKPFFNRSDEIILWNHLKEDVKIVEEFVGIDLLEWKERYTV